MKRNNHLLRPLWPLPWNGISDWRAITLALFAGSFGTAALGDGHEATKLNSELIEESFGSYGIELLHQSEGCRISNLYSGEGDERVMRTLAVVIWSPIIAPELAEVHGEILRGASIGATLKSSGWVVVKTPQWVGELSQVQVPQWLRDRMQLQAPLDLAAQRYALAASGHEVTRHYADILEIHHPEHRSLANLQEAYQTLHANPAPVQLALKDPGSIEAVDASVDACDVGFTATP